MERKLVAIEIKNGKCVRLLVCKNVDDREFNKLLNEVNANAIKEEDEKNKQRLEMESLKEEIRNLKGEIKLLKGEN